MIVCPSAIYDPPRPSALLRSECAKLSSQPHCLSSCLPAQSVLLVQLGQRSFTSSVNEIRTLAALSTMFCRARRTSVQPRVFNPQSGLTHSCRGVSTSRFSDIFQQASTTQRRVPQTGGPIAEYAARGPYDFKTTSGVPAIQEFSLPGDRTQTHPSIR
jgi:hypothetical protein